MQSNLRVASKPVHLTKDNTESNEANCSQGSIVTTETQNPSCSTSLAEPVDQAHCAWSSLPLSEGTADSQDEWVDTETDLGTTSKGPSILVGLQSGNQTQSYAAVSKQNTGFTKNMPSLEHKPEVHPVFLNFKQVAREGYKIPLVQVATAIAKAISEVNIDVIQPMQNGWQIYVKTEADRVTFMAKGIELAGKSIDLQAPLFDPESLNAKIILKDLPLHEVGNDHILKDLKKIPDLDIKSTVKYCNIYMDGHYTHLWNGDRFVHVSDQSVSKLDKSLSICGY